MNKDLQKIGSQTAKQGFVNQRQVVQAFLPWKTNTTAQQWLSAMGYIISDIEWVKAETIQGEKADIIVEIKIKLITASASENIQVKLITGANFNQIDKCWADKYQEMWHVPDNIIHILKRFSGEYPPSCKNPKDKRRMFMDEFSQDEQESLLVFLNKNKILILSDILKGRGLYAAEWFLLINKHNKTYPEWAIKPINEILNYYSQHDFCITLWGSLKIGTITLQRKGGDGGRHTANMLQFKIKPLDLFNV